MHTCTSANFWLNYFWMNPGRTRWTDSKKLKLTFGLVLMLVLDTLEEDTLVERKTLSTPCQAGQLYEQV